MQHSNALLPSGLLTALFLASAPLAGAAPDLTSAIVPDFRGWENTYYAGWTDWTALDPGGFFALADDPATNAPTARFTASDTGTMLTSGGAGVICTDGDPTPSLEFGGELTDGPVREVVLQIKTSGGAPAGVLLQYNRGGPGFPDTEFLPPSEVTQLASDEFLYRYFAAQSGLPVGTSTTFRGFRLRIDTTGTASPGCIDALQLDVRHQLDGETNSTTCGFNQLNSLNVYGGIDGGGSSVASSNLFELTASGIPNASYGYFIASDTLGFIPCGSGCGTQGELCLGGSIARILPAGLGGNDRSFSTTLDLAAIPVPGGPATVLAGSDWHFQGWYRDANPMVTSNFTQTVTVLFQ